MSDFVIVERTEPIILDEVFSFIDETNISKMDAHELKSRIADVVQEIRNKAIDEFAEQMKEVKGNYTQGNEDNLEKAVEGLDQFTKNWCMNCKETEEKNDLTFRCSECNFSKKAGSIGICLIKEFVMDKTGDMPIDFGAMGSH